MICVQCGKEFVRGTKRQVYCTDCALDRRHRREYLDGGGIITPKLSMMRLVKEGKLHCDIIRAYAKGEVSGKDNWEEVRDGARARHVLKDKTRKGAYYWWA